MAINNLKCPSCGSTPKYDEENHVYKCSYCGSELSRHYDIKPKKEVIDRMVSLGKEDFWNEDYEHSYRKFASALYYDKNNTCLKYYKEISDIPRLLVPDIDLKWDNAYTLLKEIYSNIIDEKQECFKMFLSMAKHTFTSLMKRSTDEELKEESCQYAYNTFTQIMNELKLNEDEMIEYLNAFKEILNQIINYYENKSINLTAMKEKLDEVQKKIDKLSKEK